MKSPDSRNDDLVFEAVSAPGMPRRRVGRSKETGIVLLESRLNEQGKEVEKLYYDDRGQLTKRIVYEYDENRRPRLTSVFDANGKLIWRHERGKQPESFD